MSAEVVPAETEDALLGGRLRLLQPRSGFRAAIDPVFLQAMVPAVAGERVLDLGTGSGAAALTLATRVPGIEVDGLDKQAALIALARGSAALNGLEGRVTFTVGDVLAPPYPQARFDHVMANPPYLPAGRGNVSPDAGRRAASVEDRAALADWVAAAVALARPEGTVTFVHRFDRADETAAELARAGAGAVLIVPLWPFKAGEGAKRALIQSRKGATGKAATAAGVVLHTVEGGYTEAADDVLRRGAGLRI